MSLTNVNVYIFILKARYIANVVRQLLWIHIIKMYSFITMYQNIHDLALYIHASIIKKIIYLYVERYLHLYHTVDGTVMHF